MSEDGHLDEHPRVWKRADFHSGLPCVTGTRIAVSTALHTLAMHRGDFAKVLHDYNPVLIEADILGCLRYAATLADRDR